MYEYKVVPAPVRAVKVKGLKTTADRFAHALAERINAEAAGGWQFVRTESLPCEDRTRFGRVQNSQQVMMVFARELGATRPNAGAALAAVQGEPPRAARRAPVAPAPAPVPEPIAPAETADYDTAYDEAYDEAVAEPAPAPAPASAPAAPQRRQEPLFRSGAMLRADNAARNEPRLGARAGQERDDES